jgi:hypothetical protein
MCAQQVGTCLDDAPSLVVWNLLTASVWWSAAAAVSCLAVDPAHGAFAVAFPPEPLRRLPRAQSSSVPAAPDLAALPAPNGRAEEGAAAAAAAGASPMCVNGEAANGAMPNGKLLSSPESGWESPMPGQQPEASALEGRSADGQAAEAWLGSLEASVQVASGTFWYGAGAAAGAAGRPVAGEMIGGGGGTVMLFEAGSPTPKQAWMLPG